MACSFYVNSPVLKALVFAERSYSFFESKAIETESRETQLGKPGVSYLMGRHKYYMQIPTSSLENKKEGKEEENKDSRSGGITMGWTVSRVGGEC